MCKTLIYLPLLVSLGLVACEHKVDVAAEETAIRVIVQSKVPRTVADYDRLFAEWAHEPYVGHANLSGKVKVGWDSIREGYKLAFDLLINEPDKYKLEFTRSNIDIRLNGSTAFVTHDEHVEGIWEGEELSLDRKVVVHLVKIEGEWKIVALF